MEGYRAQDELWLIAGGIVGDTWTFSKADAERARRDGFEVDGPFVRANAREGAVSIVRDLLDPDPCRYDHHGYCQAHSLHERPCPHERARDLLGER